MDTRSLHRRVADLLRALGDLLNPQPMPELRPIPIRTNDPRRPRG